MKLVTEFFSVGDAERANRLLAENGIAAFVSSKNTFQFPRGHRGASAVGLWVILDAQLWDAEQILENPNHRVEQKLSPAQIDEIHQSVHHSGMSPVLKFLFTLLGLVVLFALIVFAVTSKL